MARDNRRSYATQSRAVVGFARICHLPDRRH
jgi:hypothetical protein